MTTLSALASSQDLSGAPPQQSFATARYSDMFIAAEQLGDVHENRKRYPRTAVVFGGTSGIGKELVKSLAAKGATVYLSGRSMETASAAASEIGLNTVGIAVDLSEPESIAEALADVGSVDYLAIAGDRTRRQYDLRLQRCASDSPRHTETGGIRGGHPCPCSHDSPRMPRSFSSVDWRCSVPYPGSLTVSTVNGGVVGLVHSLVTELAPVRVNAIHPASSVTAPSGTTRTTATSSHARHSGDSSPCRKSWKRSSSCSSTPA